jgi:hypothetical protein
VANSGRRGPRPKSLTAAERLQIATLLRRHPRWGLVRIRRLVPDLPKNAAAVYIRRCKSILGRRRRRNWSKVTWHVPGAVWAIDGTWLDRPVVGSGRRALVVVELHRRQVLALQSVSGERASAVIALLERLVRQHGAPLALKADNGSAFIAACVAIFCRRHGITLMHSPVRRPRWNGTCEVSGRWAKARAQAAAARRGSVALCQQDLDAAVTHNGPLPALADELRSRFRQAYDEQLADLVRQQGLARSEPPADHLLRSLGRVAAQRALQICHILTIEGRAYHQWLPPRTA